MHPGVYIFIGFFTLVIVFGLLWAKKAKKIRRIFIDAFADKYGISHAKNYLDDFGLKLSGKIHGIQFQYSEEVMLYSDEESYPWTVLKFENCPFDFNFRCSQQKSMMRIMKNIGVNDVLIGDKDLDAELYFQTDESEKLSSVFGSQNREALLQIKSQLYGVIENNSKESTFSYYHYGRIQEASQTEPVDQVLDFMLKIQESKK